MAEKDYISREAATRAVCCACSMEGDFHKCVGYPQNSDWCEYMVSLRSISAADVRPVVLCRDCKWCHAGYCEKFDDIIPWGCADRPWEEWFCADGEKKVKS